MGMRTYKEPTDKQRWARRRNWAKLQVAGAMNSLQLLYKNSVITEVEKWRIDNVLISLQSTLQEWEKHNDRSRADFLRRAEEAKDNSE